MAICNPNYLTFETPILHSSMEQRAGKREIEKSQMMHNVFPIARSKGFRPLDEFIHLDIIEF